VASFAKFDGNEIRLRRGPAESSIAGPVYGVAAWICIVVASVLAGCKSASDTESHLLGTGPNVEAKLVPTGGSAVTGAAVLRAFDGGVVMTVSFTNIGAGAYRVVVHANGNCSSPNGFSAGPPWAPPGVTVVSETYSKNDDAGALVVRLPGYRVEGPNGVMGRSVVVHVGAMGSLDAQPGVPNNRIACGVIGPPGSIFRNLGSATSRGALVLSESRWAFSPARRS
jgi:Cu-Zn family superoxide dismutase